MLPPLRFTIHDYSFLMIPVEGGAFDMGDEVGDLWEACRPVHRVRVNSFYLAQYPVTQALWQAVMDEEWEHLQFAGAQRPMERVSWDDAQVFLENLNRQSGEIFRLPTEAEWEFAARGGNPTPALPKGDGDAAQGIAAVHDSQANTLYAGSRRLKEVGWYEMNSHGETKPVGRKFPNELGLYDLSGNVWEWCEDQWHDNYNGALDDGSAWVDREQRSYRVYRGGWRPGHRYFYLGFRLALSLQSVGSRPAGL
ncbi:MAG: SUMF1/EgtB/PvdO family nonheme iron enzyme [Saprospirales bacterium]|jgi:sulfatase modifying factor 1|nr:SUMF1/EgtB/PvdO family nonheme iron enzyme [Saprospirales bacterium]